jgi:excisionase family DNA binding protein
VKKADTTAGISAYVSVSTAANLLDLPTSWFYDRVYSRTMPFAFIRVGRQIRIPIDSLQEYLEAQRVESGN